MFLFDPVIALWDVARTRLVVACAMLFWLATSQLGGGASIAALLPAPAAPTVVPVLPNTPVPAFVDEAPYVSWDGCQVPLRVAHIQNGHGPVNAAELFTEGLSIVGTATGLEFAPLVSVGENEASGFDLTVGFSPGDPQLFGDSEEVAGVAFRRTNKDRIVMAQVWVDSSDDLRPGFGPGNTVGNVILHELGHAVGLEHIADPAALMSPAATPLTGEGFGAADQFQLNDIRERSRCLSPHGGAVK